MSTLLPDGSVLVDGGSRVTDIVESIASAERYDPSTGAWTSAGGMSVGRSFAGGSLMAAGRVVISGGFEFINPIGRTTASADVYDPDTNSWTATGSMGIDRDGHTVTLLPDGTVLAAGGYGGHNGGTLAGCEVYRPVEVPPGL